MHRNEGTDRSERCVAANYCNPGAHSLDTTLRFHGISCTVTLGATPACHFSSFTNPTTPFPASLSLTTSHDAVAWLSVPKSARSTVRRSLWTVQSATGNSAVASSVTEHCVCDHSVLVRQCCVHRRNLRGNWLIPPAWTPSREKLGTLETSFYNHGRICEPTEALVTVAELTLLSHLC